MVDALLLLLTIAPLALAIVLKVLFTPDAPLEDGVSISGALVYFTIPMPLQAWPITEAQINSWAVILSILGLFAPTSDLNIVLGWAILVFILITHYKLKGGLWEYIKGFFSPIPLFAPLNIIGEFATPISMSFRHYGNVMSGMVISTLIAYALRSLSKMLLGWLPGALGTIPFLQIGLPAVLSLYFDIFSGCMQAFIFAMLTMMFVSTAEPEEE